MPYHKNQQEREENAMSFDYENQRFHEKGVEGILVRGDSSLEVKITTANSQACGEQFERADVLNKDSIDRVVKEGAHVKCDLGFIPIWRKVVACNIEVIREEE